MSYDATDVTNVSILFSWTVSSGDNNRPRVVAYRFADVPTYAVGDTVASRGDAANVSAVIAVPAGETALIAKVRFADAGSSYGPEITVPIPQPPGLLYASDTTSSSFLAQWYDDPSYAGDYSLQYRSNTLYSNGAANLGAWINPNDPTSGANTVAPLARANGFGTNGLQHATYPISGLDWRTSYDMRVAFCDANANMTTSVYSRVYTVLGAPAVTSIAVATPTSSLPNPYGPPAAVSVSWDATKFPASTLYRIHYKRVGGTGYGTSYGTYQPVTVPTAGANNYTFFLTVEDPQYGGFAVRMQAYTASATSGGLLSADSATLTLATPPTNLQGELFDNTSATLSWDHNASYGTYAVQYRLTGQNSSEPWVEDDTVTSMVARLNANASANVSVAVTVANQPASARVVTFGKFLGLAANVAGANAYVSGRNIVVAGTDYNASQTHQLTANGPSVPYGIVTLSGLAQGASYEARVAYVTSYAVANATGSAAVANIQVPSTVYASQYSATLAFGTSNVSAPSVAPLVTVSSTQMLPEPTAYLSWTPINSAYAVSYQLEYFDSDPSVQRTLPVAESTFGTASYVGNAIYLGNTVYIGNLVFTASSTDAAGNVADNAFGTSVGAVAPDSSYWKCASNSFQVNGLPRNLNQTTTKLAGTATLLVGEWLQQRSESYGTYCGRFRLMPSANYSTTQPTAAKLLASNTGVDGTWIELWPLNTDGSAGTLTSYTGSGQAPYYTVSNGQQTRYIYYRLVFTQSVGNSVEVAGLWFEPMSYAMNLPSSYAAYWYDTAANNVLSCTFPSGVAVAFDNRTNTLSLPTPSNMGTSTSTQLSLSVNGFVPGHAVRVRVRASNSYGTGPWSADAVATLTLPVPSGLAAVANSIARMLPGSTTNLNYKMDLTWSSVTSFPGLSGYDIRWKPTGAPWTDPPVDPVYMASEVLPTVAAGPIYSASSTLSNTYSANVVFGGNIDAGGPGPNYWKCAAGAYSGAGAYVGSKTTTLSDGTTVVSGEWLQQQFQNTGSTCGDFRMFPSVNFSSYQPTNARLLASQTGVDGSWTQLWPTTGGNGTLTSYTIYNTSAPQYAVSTTSATTYLCFRLVFTASTSSSVEVGGLWIEPLRYSSSSSQSSNTADLAFDANANTLWQSADTYSTTTGLHVGGVVTVVADGTNVKGEWLQSYYHSGVGVLNLDLAAANSGLQPSLQPSTAVVLGSAYGADGTWVRVWPADGTAAPLVYLNNVTTHFTYNGIANAVYKYVRVVFPSGSGASNVQLSGITLN